MSSDGYMTSSRCSTARCSRRASCLRPKARRTLDVSIYISTFQTSNSRRTLFSCFHSLTSAPLNNLPINMTRPEKSSTPGFFRGLAPGLAGIIPARSTYFFAYSRSKDFWTNNARLGDRHRDLTEVLCGVTAGVVQNTITNPIWMVKTRMQVLILVLLIVPSPLFSCCFLTGTTAMCCLRSSHCCS